MGKSQCTRGREVFEPHTRQARAYARSNTNESYLGLASPNSSAPSDAKICENLQMTENSARQSCRSRTILSNHPLLAKFENDAGENGRRQVCVHVGRSRALNKMRCYPRTLERSARSAARTAGKRNARARCAAPRTNRWHPL